MEESNVILEFVDPFEATKFALGYAEIYGKAKMIKKNHYIHHLC